MGSSSWGKVSSCEVPKRKGLRGGSLWKVPVKKGQMHLGKRSV